MNGAGGEIVRLVDKYGILTRTRRSGEGRKNSVRFGAPAMKVACTPRLIKTYGIGRWGRRGGPGGSKARTVSGAGSVNQERNLSKPADMKVHRWPLRQRRFAGGGREKGGGGRVRVLDAASRRCRSHVQKRRLTDVLPAANRWVESADPQA